MTLTFKITNKTSLENGSPLELVLSERGAIIGRSQTCDWPLPDEDRTLSRSHCKITFDKNSYWLEDISANGTFVNEDVSKLSSLHKLKSGDSLRVGPFHISVKLTGEALEIQNQDQLSGSSAAATSDWNRWDEQPSNQQDIAPKPNPLDLDSWNPSVEKKSEISDWSDPIDTSSATQSGDNIFGDLTKNHEVDWSDTSWDVPDDFDPFTQSGVASSIDSDWGQPANGIDRAPIESPSSNWGENNSQSNPNETSSFNPSPSLPDPKQPPNVSIAQHNKELLTALGLSPDELMIEPDITSARAGRLLRRLITGTLKLLESRARAKDAMGASSTQLSLTGNNPLKFATNIDNAIQMLMNPPRKGYMDADLAIEDSFKDIQAHQIATLNAMQGALNATLERFSPKEIRRRAKKRGLLSKIIPNQMDAALWKAYEKEFSGCVEGSSEAFFDIYSKEFKKAYEDACRRQASKH